MCQWHSAAVSSWYEPEVHAQRDLLHRVGEVQIRGRRVDRIAAEDEQDADRARVHLADELLQRGALIDRAHFRGLRVDDRRADVAERLVHRVRERMDGRRLAVAGDDEAAAARGLQILDERSHPALRRSAAPSRVRRRPRPARRHRARERLDLRGAQRQPVIGLRARVRRRAFDGVETTQLRRWSPSIRRRDANARACRSPPLPAQRKSASSERMTSAFSIAYCASTYSPNASRLPSRALWRPNGSHCTHFACGKRARNSCDLRAERRRRDRLGQDPDAGTLAGLLCGEHRLHRRDERARTERISPRCVIVCERSGS